MLFKKLKGHFTTKKISHHTQNLRENKLSFESVFLIVAIWRVSGGLGLYCGGKNILGRVVFQLFGRKFLGNYIRLNFLCSF